MCTTPEKVKMHVSFAVLVTMPTLAFAVLCAEDYHVSSNVCIPCLVGTINAAGDDASGGDTTCGECAEDYHVSSDNVCTACQDQVINNVTLHYGNPAGDNVTGPETTCNFDLCAENYHVSDTGCTPCAAGKTSPGGDSEGGDNTECTATLCAEDEYVSSNVCTACAAGTNAAGDDASGADTSCDADGTADDWSDGSDGSGGGAEEETDKSAAVFIGIAIAFALAACAASVGSGTPGGVPTRRA